MSMVTIINKGTPLEEIKKQINTVVAKKKNNIKKFAGTVKLDVDPMEWQNKLRDEWR
ncbi:hypothetical protein [Pedobacter aquae]|uniref:hypothetical protein n=2 Tax=Pedobacter TaxID=84567 RepID=UPI00143D0CAA|nr:hypothetical protein [Pedobacter aquae]